MQVSIAVISAILAVCGGQMVKQEDLDKMAGYLTIGWDVTANTKETLRYQVEITLDNRSPDIDLKRDDFWQIRFFSIFMVEPDLLGVNGHKTVELPGQGIKVTHIQGSLFSMEPTDQFVTLKAESMRKIKFKALYWSVARTDIMGNWYLLAPGMAPRVIQSTQGEDLDFVSGFDRIDQWKRYNYDEYNPYTAQERYDRNYVPHSSDDSEMRVIPKPLHFEVKDRSRTLSIDARWQITYEDSINAETAFVISQLQLDANNAFKTTLIGEKVLDIRMGAVDVPASEGAIKNSPDAYSLRVDVTTKRITLIGQGRSGIICGLSTLLSLMDGNKQIPESYIVDAPRFEYRGVMLDIARNFQTKNAIIEIIQMMSLYKLNRLHLHLTDDEGWRLQIPQLPELTTIGARRCHDDTGDNCLFPQLGSGPDANTQVSSSGFLTTADYQAILVEAQRRHIQIIPEFDMPGHARAAIMAMESRNRAMVASGDVAGGFQYRLVEDGDSSVYITAQMFNDNAMNPCLTSTYSFISVVMDEIIRLHRDIQPLTVFHYGGDEVGPGAWVNSTRCQELQKSVGFASPKEYFFTQMSEMARLRNVALAAWEDGLMEGGNIPFNIDGNPNGPARYAYAWDNVWEWNATARTYHLANEGYKVVMAHGSHLYFDHPYEPDPEERGYYWATRFTDTKKTFGYSGQNVYDNIIDRRSGELVSEEEKCAEFRCPVLNKPENIIGIEAAVFSETTRTREQLHDRLFPRLLAVAERAWHHATWENVSDSKERKDLLTQDWYSFVRAVGHRELPRLEAAGIKYRIPPAGAIVFRNHLLSTPLYPGLSVEYSFDAGNSWKQATSFVDLENYDNRIWLRTRSIKEDRYSRTVVLNQETRTPPTTQPMIDYIASNVGVTFTLNDNSITYGNSFYKASVTLTNQKNTTIPYGTWAIYFISVQWIEGELLKQGKRFVDHESQMYIEHVQGYLFKMGPTSSFKGLLGSQAVTVTFRADAWFSSRTDQMPNWYVSAPGMTAQNIRSTVDNSLSFVSDLDTPDKWKRMKADAFDPWTPAVRYDRNHEILATSARPSPIIPTPMKYTSASGVLDLTSGDWLILYDIDANKGITTASVATYMEETLKAFIPDIKAKAQASTSTTTKIRTIHLRLRNVNANTTSNEAYTVEVLPASNGIIVTSPNIAGMFHGAVSVVQLALQPGQYGKVAGGMVTDWPRFAYRGMMVDVARNFQPKQVIFRLLDAMRMYKLNKLHLHLTDDEGWRLEIPGLDELTSIGAKRCHSPDETECIMSTLGSGADTNSPGSGFYTVADYQEILTYASQRDIEVIPEIDFPGHTHAAIRSMRVRRQRNLDLGYTYNAMQYLLDETDDPSFYLSIQFYDDNAANPCMESTYSFLAKVLDEVKKMHASIQPLKMFHFGGDEVAKGAWKDSKECITLRNTGVNLKEHFTRRVSELTKELTLGAWEDGLMDHGNTPWNRSLLENNDVIAYAWQNVWEWGAGRRAYDLANDGYQVVLSPVTHTYFDHPQEPDPEEMGYYWGTRYADVFKVLSFLPDDLYRNIHIAVSGQPLTREAVCGKDSSNCPPLTKPENIIGIQGQLWSETVRSEVDYRIYPRLLALADKAWHKGLWEEKKGAEHKTGLAAHLSNFAHAMGSTHLKILDKFNIEYRVPPPGARQSREKILTNVEYPGLQVQYKKGQSWLPLTSGTRFAPPITVRLRTASSDGKRFSRQVAVKMTTPPPQAGDGPVFGISLVLCIVTTLIHLLSRLQ